MIFREFKSKQVRRFAMMIMGAALACLGSQQAQAENGSGNYMLKACDSGNESLIDYGMCLGRLDGLRSGLYMGEAFGAVQVICYPAGATLGQQADVLRGYLRRHPERRHVVWHFLALHAFAEAWPCAGDYEVVWDAEKGWPTLAPK